jgi:hypothetical protein
MSRGHCSESSCSLAGLWESDRAREQNTQSRSDHVPLCSPVYICRQVFALLIRPLTPSVRSIAAVPGAGNRVPWQTSIRE